MYSENFKKSMLPTKDSMSGIRSILKPAHRWSYQTKTRLKHFQNREQDQV